MFHATWGSFPSAATTPTPTPPDDAVEVNWEPRVTVHRPVEIDGTPRCERCAEEVIRARTPALPTPSWHLSGVNVKEPGALHLAVCADCGKRIREG